MKKRIFSFLLATLMLVCLCFAGCGEKDLTAEEYLRESVKADLENASFDFETGKVSVGVGDLGYLLDLLQANDDSIPEIKDLALDIYGSAEGTANIILSGLVNGEEMDIALGGNTATGELTVASSLMEKTYGVKLEDVIAAVSGDTDLTEMSAALTGMSAMTDELVKYSEDCVDLMIANSTLTEADGEKGKVLVTVDMNAEQFGAFAVGVVELMKNSEFFTELFGMLDVDMNEAFAEFEAGKEEFLAEIAELGAAMNITLTIDKKTCIAEAATGTMTMDGETVTFSATETENSASFNISAGEEMTADFVATYDENGINVTMDITADGSTAAATFTAADGKVDFSVSADGVENFGIAGEYTAVANSLEFLLTEISVSGIAIDLTDAGITVGYELDCEMPEMPVADEMITDFTENGPLSTIAQEIAMNFMLKSGMFSMMY